MKDCLLLNADASPACLLPLSEIGWQEAIQKLVSGKAYALAWHEDWIVHSANWSTKVPAVLMLTEYQKPKVTIRFSKENVFLRDEYTCQYCGSPLPKGECTLDHVLPTSMGGKTTWLNSVTACFPCNSRKGNDHSVTPRHYKPHKPDYWELVGKRKKLPFIARHPSWHDYLR